MTQEEQIWRQIQQKDPNINELAKEVNNIRTVDFFLSK